jgi:phospholipid/cholesterol/gamma-HCH transport system permease protein
MNPNPQRPATLTQACSKALVLSGAWTARGIGAQESQLKSVQLPPQSQVSADATHIDALDTAGAWLLQELLMSWHKVGAVVTVQGMKPEFAKLLTAVQKHVSDQATKAAPATAKPDATLETVGHAAASAAEQFQAMLEFVGKNALVGAQCLAHPSRIRWRPVLFNIRRAGFDALPIVGLLSFMLGVVVAYQGSDQLRQYGANIFVADLIGLSMLREFAPLITAIIIAGRSGSAFAAQIGTMAVTEEIDAMRTIGIEPLELLVLPKVMALVIVLPLLTVYADVLGVFGGMIMARSQLDVGFGEFMDRLVKAVSITSYLVGVGKAPVFAVIISVVGCFQGFRTHGGADSVGSQTTKSVVQSIFLVIVADGLFSVAFSLLDL